MVAVASAVSYANHLHLISQKNQASILSEICYRQVAYADGQCVLQSKQLGPSDSARLPNRPSRQWPIDPTSFRGPHNNKQLKNYNNLSQTSSRK